MVTPEKRCLPARKVLVGSMVDHSWHKRRLDSCYTHSVQDTTEKASQHTPLFSECVAMAQEEEGPLSRESESSRQVGLEENAQARRLGVGL